MSVRYRNSSGSEVIVSGLTPGGDIEAGAVMTRTGQFANETALNNWAVEGKLIIFDSPMPDADYELEFSYPSDMGYFIVRNKTTNGFTGFIQRTFTSESPAGSLVVKYKATKTYTVQHAQQNAEDIAALKQATPAGAGPSNKFATANDITRVETKVEDISDVIESNASITNKLVTQSTLTSALEVKQNVLTFDSTPTLNSNNPVTSNGVKTAIQQITQLIPTDASASNKLITTSEMNNAFNTHKFTYQQFSDNTQVAVTGSGASGRTPKLLWTVSNIAIPTSGVYLAECWIQSLQRMNGPVNFYVGILDPTAGTNNGNPGLYNTIYAAGDYTVIRDFRILTFNSAPTTTNIYIGLDIMNNTQVTIQGKSLKIMRIAD